MRIEFKCGARERFELPSIIILGLEESSQYGCHDWIKTNNEWAMN